MAAGPQGNDDMSGNTNQPIATLGDVHLDGRGRPASGAQLTYALVVRRLDPFSGDLDQVKVSNGMALFAGDVLSARAFVSGLDVHFGDRVEELIGRALVSHEMTHVIQQGRNTASPMNNGALESEGGEDESSEPAGTPFPTTTRSVGPPPFDVESVEAESTE
jgi:hypothetical protein